LFTLTMLLIHDLSYYLFHRMQHRVPILWELHKVHHSAEAMVGFTKYRMHPLDILIEHCWDALFVGIVYGVWLFYARDPVESLIFGINVYRFRNIVTLDFISHTHYKISYGPFVNNILMSPHYHQLHHSALPEHWNKNFSIGLSCWDRLFGTLMAPKPNENFIFGLRMTDRESEEYHAWWWLYIVPLLKMTRMLIRQPVLVQIRAWTRLTLRRRQHRIPDGRADPASARTAWLSQLAGCEFQAPQKCLRLIKVYAINFIP
jgi:sterol desaturase/sphingolipid hydroxylase (fatty acid hydroxylase superfamily)